MRSNVGNLLFVFFVIVSGCQQSKLNPSELDKSKQASHVIYGNDDRFDYSEINDYELRQLAHSTVALIDHDNMVYDRVFDQYILQNPDPSVQLCSNEKFRKQPTWAFCSGSLVAPDIILTAGHCVEDKKTCKGTYFVFDYTFKNLKIPLHSLPAQNVFKCSEIIYTVNIKNGADFALIRLDRTVNNRAVLELADQDPDKTNDLFIIGHPAGYPTKFTMNVKVRSEANTDFLVVTADSYVGNSGSSVFDIKDRKIVGVLDRGEKDYTMQNSCLISKVCSEDECRGEDVTRISVVRKFLKSLQEAD